MPDKRELRLYPQAARDLASIYDPLRTRIVKRLRLLRSFPEMGMAMTDEYAGWRTTPVGIFRIIYRISRNAVEVLFIRHAKRELPLPPQ